MANLPKSTVICSRKRLARIRCLKECIQCFKANTLLPIDLCYISAEVEFKTTSDTRKILFSEPSKQSQKIAELKLCKSGSVFICSGEEFCNSQGQWAKVTSYILSETGATQTSQSTVDETTEPMRVVPEQDTWIIIHDSQKATRDKNTLVSANEDVILQSKKDQTNGRIPKKKLSSWEEIVEQKYTLKLGKPMEVTAMDTEAVARLQSVPPGWNIEHDEELVQFLVDNIEPENETLGSIKNYVESIDVSSFCDDDGAENMTDGDPETFWESDGSQNHHWVKLKMKKGTIIKKLLITVDGNDDNYLPYRIIVSGGETDNLKKLNDMRVDQNMSGIMDVCILEDMTEHYPMIEIKIMECKDEGIDTRIHGIKIKSSKEREMGLSKDLFTKDSLIRYPRLDGKTPEALYRRSLLLQRFISLLDSVLPYIIPSWEFSIGSYSSMEVIRQLLPLSKKRMSLLETFLRESELGRPPRIPKLFVNRRSAADHKQDPSLDPECKNTVFNQIYEGLKPRDRYEKQLDYRWPSRYDQWWECKFLSEGIIDQGGGFRDSLADMAEELCPSDNEVPMPLPFFIRSPNQSHEDSNVNRDVYVPNPQVTMFEKYGWIGQLMGACFRGKESLVLSLPSFIWKKLAGESTSWSRDYPSVDAAEVKLIDTIRAMDKDAFEAYFGEGSERTWTTTLSDGSVKLLKEGGVEEKVQYEDRCSYCDMVQQARMQESQSQVEALRQGLLKVVPQSVLDLLTWQELERRICGDPDITIEQLKRSTHYEDLEVTDTRVKYLWDALTNFSSEDRSRFLRFVTGRRRLPAPLYICPDKGESNDALPESSTCSNTLYLPNYTCAKVAEAKLRYAAYNCVAIDTDMNPWDE
ncbi:unnamed protein product [Owenia fusiformis]|uniref:E3 ubiquitin-protein ligase HECTD3 n=1 Tax=Owenia fusiformis TaxID=6347 RepID=A0A8S4N1U4_OWEFU|nr:unnamed protein product [Owenia fusiformis]